MFFNNVNVLPVVSWTRRVTLLFHEEGELTLGFGAGKDSGGFAHIVSTLYIEQEFLLKVR